MLSVVGLYGVMTYNTSRRQGEIGVRLALGAMPRDVLMVVLREGLLLVVLGLLIGVPLVGLGAEYVKKELFQMTPLDPASLFAAPCILLTPALLAIAIPAIRASALRLMDALHQEWPRLAERQA